MRDTDKPLANRTALVTGGAKRLGRAIAHALAEAGADVIIHYRSSAGEAGELAAELQAMGRRAWLVSADLEDPAQADGLLDQAVELAGPVDILVNNASVFPESRLADFSPEHLYTNININALAPALIARRFAAQERPGDVLNLLDCRIADYDDAHAAYHLSKRMLFTLTRMMALEFAPAVRVNAIAPGLILAPEGKGDAYLDSLATTNPLKRHGTPGDIASAAVFLLSSPFITGQVLFVDGGRHMIGSVYG
ncbi:MAG: SDR family oxidoreductase [Candidatus Hydrogenedentes bacterium]|nr:SDR family oxidoreductase [Candidatus Hydrogenedentota bacterium]